MRTRICALLLMLLLLAVNAAAAQSIDWDTAAGQDLSAYPAVTQMKEYISHTNEDLLKLGTGQIAPCYELYPTFASLGLNDAELPEHAEITVTMDAGGIVSLVLRMDSMTSFAEIGGALVHETSPDTIPLESAVAAVQSYVIRAQTLNEGGNAASFEETVSELQGSQTRIYGAYYLNQYGDGINWIQLTIIFPQAGSEGGGLLTVETVVPTEEPDNSTGEGDEISGYYPYDGFQDNHLEVFPSDTPEPDSAAMEPW